MRIHRGLSAVVAAVTTAPGILFAIQFMNAQRVSPHLHSAAIQGDIAPRPDSRAALIPEPSPVTRVEMLSEDAPRRVFSIPQAPVAIDFPDGESVTVTIRRVPPLIPIDKRAIAIGSAGIGRVDEGEKGDSAFTQYQRSMHCLALLQGTTGAASTLCAGDAEDQAAESARWLRMAAEEGNVHAIRMHAQREADSANALEVLDRAWRAGFIAPLGRIASLYFESPHAPDEQQSNRVLGFAHLWLQVHLQDVAAGQGRRSYVAFLYENLRARQANMEPKEIEEALQLAKEMLKGNEHCCFGP